MPDQPFVEIEQRLFAAAAGRIRVFGIRRAGQHAIINWILRNSGQDHSVFLNSCTMRRSCVRTCGQSELNGRQTGKGGGLATALSRFLAPEIRPFVLISYEAGYDHGDITPNFADQSFDHEVLITRSFVNWLPSFIRLMRLMNPKSKPEALDISHGITFEMARYKAHLLAAQNSAQTVICFDKWAELPDYRLARLAGLGLPVIDNSLGKVQSYGRGSSFSGQKLPAESLALTRRWQSMEKDAYAQMFLRMAMADEDFMATLKASYPEDAGLMRQLISP